MTKKSLQEHRLHILTDVTTKNNPLEKMSSLKEPPMCHTRLAGVSHLCCNTSELKINRSGRAGVAIFGRLEKVQKIDRLPGCRYIEGITCTGRGKIVVSGGLTDGRCHVTVTNVDGARIRQRVENTGMSGKPLYCYCVAFKTDEVIIAGNNEIGIFDTCDGSYRNKALSQVAKKSPPEPLRATCVTSDDIDNAIIVGCQGDPNLYILNEQLELFRTLRLPEGMREPRGITVKDGNIIICDEGARRACLVDLDGGISHEFKNPMADMIATPFRVCVDSKGYTYVMWGDVSGMGRVSSCVIAQYSPDDDSLFGERPVDPDLYLSSMTTARIGDTEKLLVTPYRGGRMHVYGLLN